MVDGCTHTTVGPIVRGAYTLSGENHGKPAYKKDSQVNGLDVMMYFWDERDGPNFCGWWFGPKIGGDQVWAYHPNKSTQTPPKTGWKVPYDGPVDATFVIAKAGAGQPAAGAQQAAWGQQPQQQPGVGQPQQQQQQALAAWLQAQGQPQNPQQQQQQLLAQRQQQMQQLEEMRRQQQMQQQEEIRRQQLIQQQQMQQRQEEERRRREAQMAQMRVEQGACSNIRRVILKLRMVRPETFEELQKELLEVLQRELANCGSHAEIIKQEADMGLQQARQRLEQIRQEQLRAEEHLKSLEVLVDEAEKAGKSLIEEAEPLQGKGALDMKLEEVEATAKAVDEAGAHAKEKMQACTVFILQKGVEMRAADAVPPGQPVPEDKLTLSKLLVRINDTTKNMDATLQLAKASKEKAARKLDAEKKVKVVSDIFTKYDSDKDGMLSRKEIEKYAKGEFNFEVSKAVVDDIIKYIAGGGKGVKKVDFQKLKVDIGIAREQLQDSKRKEVRLEKERKLVEMKEELVEKLNAVVKQVDGVEEKISKVENDTSGQAMKVKELTSEEMITTAEEAEAGVKEIREESLECRKAAIDLMEGVEAELKVWLFGEQKKIEFRLGRFEPRLSKATTMASMFRAEAKKKDFESLVALEKKALKLLKGHQRVKDLTGEELFEAVDSEKDAKISKSEWLAFFKTCEKQPKSEKKKEETADGEAKKEDGEAKKEEEKEAKDEPKEEAGEPEPTEEELAKVFATLASTGEDDEETISKDDFVNFVRVFMKVGKETVITSDLSIKESTTHRRLDVGEVVEIVKGPMEEGTVQVQRVMAKVMKDELQGWITVSGSQGTLFLEEGGSVFRVVVETILTDTFQLNGTAHAGEDAKKMIMPRKLRVGELVEVREWFKKEEQSGLIRMRCRCRTDGAWGWVTIVGNQGTVFLQVV